jgi:hypothetical protein
MPHLNKCLFLCILKPHNDALLQNLGLQLLPLVTENGKGHPMEWIFLRPIQNHRYHLFILILLKRRFIVFLLESFWLLGKLCRLPALGYRTKWSLHHHHRTKSWELNAIKMMNKQANYTGSASIWSPVYRLAACDGLNRLFIIVIVWCWLFYQHKFPIFCFQSGFHSNVR